MMGRRMNEWPWRMVGCCWQKFFSLPPEFWVINTPLLRKVWDFFIVCKHIFHRFDDSGTSYIILTSNLPKEVIFKRSPNIFRCYLATFWRQKTIWQKSYFYSFWQSFQCPFLHSIQCWNDLGTIVQHNFVPLCKPK